MEAPKHAHVSLWLSHQNTCTRPLWWSHLRACTCLPLLESPEHRRTSPSGGITKAHAHAFLWWSHQSTSRLLVESPLPIAIHVFHVMLCLCSILVPSHILWAIHQKVSQRSCQGSQWEQGLVGCHGPNQVGAWCHEQRMASCRSSQRALKDFVGSYLFLQRERCC